jgi:hypothetical protein
MKPIKKCCGTCKWWERVAKLRNDWSLGFCLSPKSKAVTGTCGTYKNEGINCPCYKEKVKEKK